MKVVAYVQKPGDIRGRCTSQGPIARVLYDSGWAINVCSDCLTIEEVDSNLHDCP